jgi:peroxiredoxin family protein
MDLLVILRDALGSSLAGGLLTAIQARKAGSEVGVLVTQEALAALARGSFGWPRELSGQANRLGLADRGAAAGIPLLGRGEGRQLDPRGLVQQAREAGVVLYACPIWASLLSLEDELPQGLAPVVDGDVARLILGASRVVGAL